MTTVVVIPNDQVNVVGPVAQDTTVAAVTYAPFANTPGYQYAHLFAGSDAGVKIQAAHDALPSAGGVVDARLLMGTQSVSTPVTLSKTATVLLGPATYTANKGFAVITGNGVQLLGASAGATQLQGTATWTGTDFYMIDAQGVAGLVIDGLAIDVTATGATVEADNYILGILVRDDTSHATGSTDFQITHNHITTHGTDPGTGNKKYGILCWTRTAGPPRLTTGGRITHNYIYATGGRNIELALCENVVVANNTIVQGGGTDTLVCVGIRVIGSRNISVTGNTVDVTDTSLVNADCLQVNGDNLNENVVFAGNACRTVVAGGSGIKVGSNSQNITVSGNDVLYVGTATSAVLGIMVSNSVTGDTAPTQVLVSGNRVSGFPNQLGIQRATTGDAFPTDVAFLGNYLGLRWDGTDSLVTFFNISSANLVTQRIWIANNKTATLTGVVSYDERSQGVQVAPAFTSTYGIALPSSADNGDAGVTLTWLTSSPVQVWNTALGSPRTVTLSTTAAINGAMFRVVRTAAATGASALNVGSGPLKALAVGTWCVVGYNGSAWVLLQYGAL